LAEQTKWIITTKVDNNIEQPATNLGALTVRRLRILPLLPEDTWEKYFQKEENAKAFIEVADMSQWSQEMQGLREWIEKNLSPELWAEMDD
jgi:hypothetical protein